MDKFYLYIKESPLGIKYLGQTTRDPYKYRGSGKYWRRHLKANKVKGTDIKTTILLETFDEAELVELGIYYSKLWNIVESQEWANLCYESGGSSTLGAKSPEHVRQILLETNSTKVIHKESGEIFNSIREAADSMSIWKTTLGHHLLWASPKCSFKYLDEPLNEEAYKRRLNRSIKVAYRNPKSIPNKSSRYPGVHRDKARNKWSAQIRIGDKRKHLGRFDLEIDAKEAYEKALEDFKNNIKYDRSKETKH